MNVGDQVFRIDFSKAFDLVPLVLDSSLTTV
jgi:hypothetical protein